MASCPPCGTSFSGARALHDHLKTNQHQNRAEEVNDWQCPVCKLSLLSGLGPFRDHIKGTKHDKKVRNQETLDMVSTPKVKPIVATRASPNVMAMASGGARPKVKITSDEGIKTKMELLFAGNLIRPTGMDMYQCNACKTGISGETNVKVHIQGKPHKKKLDAIQPNTGTPNLTRTGSNPHALPKYIREREGVSGTGQFTCDLCNINLSGDFILHSEGGPHQKMLKLKASSVTPPTPPSTNSSPRANIFKDLPMSSNETDRDKKFCLACQIKVPSGNLKEHSGGAKHRKKEEEYNRQRGQQPQQQADSLLQYLPNIARNLFPAAGEQDIWEPISQAPVLASLNKSAELSKIGFYPMDKPGLCLVFDFEKFTSKTHAHRSGTKYDRLRINKLFTDLGHEVRVFQDLTGVEFKMKMGQQQAFLNEAGNDYSALYVFVLSHGEEGAIICKDGQKYEIKSLVTTFISSNCPKFHGKPKVFFINACRGTRKLKGIQVHSDGPVSSSVQSDLSDILVCYSTLPEHESFRIEGEGSYYIQTLCDFAEKQMNRAGHEEDECLEDILKMINSHMSNKPLICGEGTERKEYRQMTSCDAIGLTKKIGLRMEPKRRF